MLWSDRGDEQASRSLRTELTKIRDIFGDHVDVLRADRKHVSLDPKRVCIELPSQPGDVFLDGLGIRDRAFDAWLKKQRAEFNRTIARANVSTNGMRREGQDRGVALVSKPSADAATEPLRATFRDAVVRTVRDICNVSDFETLPPSLEDYALVITADVLTVPGQGSKVLLRVERTDDGAAIWSGNAPIDMDLIDGLLDLRSLSLVNQMFSELCRFFAREDAAGQFPARRLAALGIFKSFSVNSTQLTEAMALLEKAFEGDPKGVFLAWQAQILTIQLVERFEEFDGALVERGDALCEKALELDKENSLVLSAVANFRTIVDRNDALGIQLAKKAAYNNPANPLAWWSLSNAVQYRGDKERAHMAAVRAHQLSSGTRLEFWSAFQRSLVSMITGRLEEGKQLGELSSALQPEFRPPKRYLAALYSTLKDVESGKRIVRSLRKYERDFSIDRFVNDDEYPVRLMRNEGLLDVDTAREFE